MCSEGPSDAAREAGLNPKRGHKILETTRERYAKALKVARLAVLIPVVGLGLLWVRGTSYSPWVMEGRWSNVRTAQPPRVKELGGLDDPDSLRKRVAELRARAAAECDALEMTECYEDMQLADSLDPDRAKGTTVPPGTSAKPGR